MIGDNPEILHALELYKDEIEEQEAERQAAQTAMEALRKQEAEELARAETEAAAKAAAEATARAESVAKSTCISITDDLLNVNPGHAIAVTQEWPDEWIPGRVLRAESIRKTNWQLRELGGVATLAIARTFYWETGGWDEPHYTPTADLWIYSPDITWPLVAITNRHDKPERLTKANGFKDGSWQNLARTLLVMQDAITEGI